MRFQVFLVIFSLALSVPAQCQVSDSESPDSPQLIGVAFLSDHPEAILAISEKQFVLTVGESLGAIKLVQLTHHSATIMNGDYMQQLPLRSTSITGTASPDPDPFPTPERPAEFTPATPWSELDPVLQKSLLSDD